jgi:hypothetical protein
MRLYTGTLVNIVHPGCKFPYKKESRVWAATAGFSDLCGTAAVRLDFRHFTKTLGQTFQKLSIKCRLSQSDRIVAPQTGLANCD